MERKIAKISSTQLEDEMKVISVNISKERGTNKHPVETITLDQLGIVDDAHRGRHHRQISILSKELIDKFSQGEQSRNFSSGEFAENITTEGIDLSILAPLDRLIVGTCELEVTQIGKKCHGDGCSIFREVGKCVMPQDGIFCRVIRGGTIIAGDNIEFYPRTLKFKIITLSDRAAIGEYEDLSGPQIENMIAQHFEDSRWHCLMERVIIADESEELEKQLQNAKKNNTDIIFTCGGTGIGPRDITVDVVTKHCQKLIPGIMDHIRLKYGANKPNALISRSVAGVIDQTLIFTLPGSVKAVTEYMTEIIKPLEHMICMLHGLGH